MKVITCTMAIYGTGSIQKVPAILYSDNSTVDHMCACTIPNKKTDININCMVVW